MDTKTIESQYIKMLTFSYGNIDNLINELDKGINLYKNSKNKNNQKAKYRMNLYSKIIEYAKSRR